MQLILVGVNHRTAPIAVRERLAFDRAAAMRAAKRLLASPGVREAAILSTCNRTEIYAAGECCDRAPIVKLLCDRGIPEEALTASLFEQRGADAALHLHRVAAGLDSMVLGEAQVLAQVKEALALAAEAQSCGPVLDRLFRSAITAGKRVRTETALGRGAVSVSHAAVELARRLFGDLRGLKAMILGAGEMSKVTARLLANAGIASILVTNRTYERAHELAMQLGGKAVHFDEFPRYVAVADVVICSTAAPHAVVHLGEMRRIMAARPGHPLVLIDIAVPRDVEPEVGELEGVSLFCIDDLQAVVDGNMAERRAELDAAEQIAAAEAARFGAWLPSLAAAPILAALQAQCEQVVQGELEKVEGRLQHLSGRDREVVSLLAHGVAKRLLKEPIAQMKRLAGESEPQPPLAVARALFGIEDPANTDTPTAGAAQKNCDSGN